MTQKEAADHCDQRLFELQRVREASKLVSTWQYPIILELHVPALRPKMATQERMTENRRTRYFIPVSVALYRNFEDKHCHLLF